MVTGLNLGCVDLTVAFIPLGHSKLRFCSNSGILELLAGVIEEGLGGVVFVQPALLGPDSLFSFLFPLSAPVYPAQVIPLLPLT